MERSMRHKGGSIATQGALAHHQRGLALVVADMLVLSVVGVVAVLVVMRRRGVGCVHVVAGLVVDNRWGEELARLLVLVVVMGGVLGLGGGDGAEMGEAGEGTRSRHGKSCGHATESAAWEEKTGARERARPMGRLV